MRFTSPYDFMFTSTYLSPIGPPWSEIVAYDLNTGDIKWRVPHGRVAAPSELGIPADSGAHWPRGGLLATAGGLLFAASGSDKTLRAYDRQTGRVVWTHALPAASDGVPASYEIGGRQFIVVPVAAGHGWNPARFPSLPPARQRLHRVRAAGYGSVTRPVASFEAGRLRVRPYFRPQKMNVPRLVAVTMSIAPSRLRSSASTFDPTPLRLWTSCGTNSAPPGARLLRTVRYREHRRSVGVGVVERIEVGPGALADDEVGHTVAIDVGHGAAVQLGERDAAGVGVEKSSMIMWRVKRMAPPGSRTCSNQARPKPCAWRLVTTSARPSPFTS